MADTYTVKRGDTLSEIAEANLSTIRNAAGNQSLPIYGAGGAIELLAKWNNISNPDIIIVGQVIKLTNSSGGSETTTTNNTNRPIINLFGLQSNTDSTIFASWKWDKSYTENYEVMWHYATGDGLWFVGNKSTTEFKQSTYNAPSNATKVKFKVKAVSKKHKINNEDVSYWTGEWSTEKIYQMSDNPPKQPSAPTVTLDQYSLTGKLDNLDVNATHILFEVTKNNTSVYTSVKAQIRTNHAEFTTTVPAGNEYKVRCRAIRGDLKSAWSEYSSSIKGAPYSTVITTCVGKSATSLRLEWVTVLTADSYTLEYTTQNDLFGIADEVVSKTGIEFSRYELTGLESGHEYFFRVKAVNSSGESAWSPTVSLTIGKPPTSPTTWSSSTTVVTGEPLIVYWVHNSQDGSSQVSAVIELYLNGELYDTLNIPNSQDEDEKDKTSSYSIDTSAFLEGAQLKWRVRTCGVTEEFGDWSVERIIDVYSPPTLQLLVSDSVSPEASPLETLTSFPFFVQAMASPNTQSPTGYHLSITANEPYETVDQYGNFKMVNVGEEIYSKQFNTSGDLVVILSAENITLENNISYTVTCVVSMNSGLVAESSSEFKVAWTDEEYVPNAEIGISPENFTASIRPYLEDENGDVIEGVLLSVYRREFDGGFTELAKDIVNTSNTYITDPHPALDYARYRIVAKTESTGKISYTDLPGYPVGGKAVIIQWDEEWTSFDSPEAEETEHPSWGGSMLKLPYNVDVSDKYNPDVELVEYIGRSHAVSYYGTQKGITSTWNVVIPKEDKETLYALRRLALYMGDVYVREPSGSGYWANISVSFGQKHCEVTIPVTFDITRVEGGM